MKILVVGAGAIGGYFGGRLMEKGEDVTFLVREKRRQQLERDGLIVESVNGDMNLKPKTLVNGEEAPFFDVVLMTTKAYHLEDAVESVRQYVGEETMILPVLNGIAHIPNLIEAFGDKRVLGGVCLIETTLDHEGKVIHSSPIHDLIFGERSGEKTDRILKLQDVFSGTKAPFRLSDQIVVDMWQKYLFIVTFSGVTSLFRSPIGPIRDQEFGLQTIKNVIHETLSIMKAIGVPLADGMEAVLLKRMIEIGYSMKSSLQRDVEKQQLTEADHFFGFLLNKAKEQQIDAPVLSAIYANLKVYENRLDY
ncbi:MAG: ketopantoate reductase family protein [Bacillota bacterium]|nr:ketopantoate reductase family protein [Bacillota bacterium]